MAKWSRFAPGADRRLVKGLLNGDDDALATLYDVYAERLHDYCVALITDQGDAADIVHDTFIDAARRTPRMRERELLRAWLYAGIRRRCLGQTQPNAMIADETFARLDFPQREALYLFHRHDLDGDDLAAVLGIATRRAQARLRRARRQVPEAGEILSSAEPPALPPALRHRVLHAGSDPELAGYRAEVAARGGALTPDGMPRQPDAPSRLARRWAVASVVSVAALAAAFAALVVTQPELPVPDWPGSGEHPPSEHQERTPERHSHGPAARPGTAKAPSKSPPPAAPQIVTPTRHPTAASSPGTLSVTPRSVRFSGGVRAVDLRLSASGGPVSWTATESAPQVTLSADQGRVPAGGHAVVRVELQRSLLTLPGTATVTLADGTGHSIAVSVSWDLSVL